MKKRFLILLFFVICLFSFPFMVVAEPLNDINKPVSDYSSSDSDDDSYYIMSIFVMIMLFFGGSVFCEIGRKRKKDSRNNNDSKFIGDCDKIIKKYFSDLDEEKLLNILIDKFLEIQKAKVEFDYNTLKKNCTKELYQMYKNDLEILKDKKQEKIVNNIEIGVSNIKNIEEQNGIVIIDMYLRVDSNNYIIDIDTGKVVRGNKNDKDVNQYNLQFIKTKKLIDKCPNCNSLLNKKSICSYCNTYVDIGYDDFVLSSKKKI